MPFKCTDTRATLCTYWLVFDMLKSFGAFSDNEFHEFHGFQFLG